MAVTLEQFVANLTRSGLFTAAELAAFQQGLPPEKRAKEPPVGSGAAWPPSMGRFKS
jgi:hypothetical protein